MSRAHDVWGSEDVDVLFNEHPVTSVPFQRASRRKDRKDYDQATVNRALREPNLAPVDPREVAATQPSVTRAGVKHYMSGSEEIYGQDKGAGNRHPVVYEREDGQKVLLSGHHRATAALLQGKQFRANVVRGPWGPPR